MSVTVTFSKHGKSIELSEQELHELNNALLFAMNGGTHLAMRKFGSITVEATHKANTRSLAFDAKQQQATRNTPTVLTDC